MRLISAFVALAFITLAQSVVFADDNLDEPRAIEKIELLGGNPATRFSPPSGIGKKPGLVSPKQRQRLNDWKRAGHLPNEFNLTTHN